MPSTPKPVSDAASTREHPSLNAAPDELAAMFAAAEEFLATTSIFRQRRESRDAFEKLALAVLTVRMMNAGQALGEIVTGDEPLVIEDGSGV